MPPTLLVPVVPPGWIQLTGPDHAILAVLDPADPRLLHVRAALDSGRFEDALAVLGRAGPPTAVAARLEGSAVRVVTSLSAYAEALVGGRRREIRSDPRLGWADITLHDAASVALLPPPSAVAAATEVAAAQAPAPDLVLAPLPPQVPQASVPPPSAPSGRVVIDHLPWATAPEPPVTPAAPPQAPPPTPPAPEPPAGPAGWVPAAPPVPVSRTYTPYAVPQPPPSPAPPVEDRPAQDLPAAPPLEPVAVTPPDSPEPDLAPAAPAPTAAYPPVPDPHPKPAHAAHPIPLDDPEALDATIDRSALLGAAGAPHAPSGVSVLAVLCPAGHVSPPHSSTCRTCGREVPVQEPFSTPRPSLGVLRLSTGDLVTLDRGVLLGRAPQVEPGLPVAQRPHVVRVFSPQRDVSRTHLEVILEGWHVLVRDLATTNGTTVTLPGREPVRLLPHDQQVIEPGTLVSLADEVTFTFEIAG